MLNQHTALEGNATFQLIDRCGAVTHQHHQRNLILNSGLDNVAVHGLFGLQNLFSVGTGSAVPDVTQTALAAEIGRTGADGGVAAKDVLIGDGGAERIVTREFGFDEVNGNLTEWGFASTSGGKLNIRQLFRDGQGNPVVLTKTSSQKLRVTHTLKISIGPLGAQPVSFVIDGVGQLTGTHTFYRVAGRDLFAPPYMFNRIAVGTMGNGYGQAAIGVNTVDGMFPAALVSSYQQTPQGTAYGAPATGLLPYVPGSYRRSLRLELPTNLGNGTHFEYIVGAANGDYAQGRTVFPYGGWVFKYDAASRLVKTDTKTLTLDLGHFSWGRA